MVFSSRRNAHFHISGLWMAVLRYLGGILGYLRPSWAISGSLSLSLFRAEHCLNPTVPKNMFDISSKLSQESALPVPMLGQVYVKWWFRRDETLIFVFGGSKMVLPSRRNAHFHNLALKMAQDSLKTAQDGSKTVQEGPRCLQVSPKMAQDGPKVGPRRLQDGSAMARDGPR